MMGLLSSLVMMMRIQGYWIEEGRGGGGSLMVLLRLFLPSRSEVEVGGGGVSEDRRGTVGQGRKSELHLE